jgi:formylglycine-generating enzyme required for sulfatase activity
MPNYAKAPSDGSAVVLKGCDSHVQRGGSFRSAHDGITTFVRSHSDPSLRAITNGFRVATQY